MNLIVKKIISVVSGYFASLPFFFVNINPIVDSLILMVFFIAYYALIDYILEKIEQKISKEELRK
ncbi:MAG: hypothetical protein DRI44_06090 [Chlamydiae bacterium]|nr:MAG: hypothetical protein DRI44_06090 [Chlamydiota bacterium]